jgi:uncharacterized protein (DUF1697 family)
MTTHRYAALLRGINVGGNNIIKMVDLRQCFEALGFANVATYIQSGNVVFSAQTRSKKPLEARIEDALSQRFGYAARIVLVSLDELAQTVTLAPKGFGTEPERYRYDVLFVKAPLTPAAALAELSTKAGVDTAHAGSHALYFRRLISKATQSRLTKLVQLGIYKSITVRNWNTTIKLLELARA